MKKKLIVTLEYIEDIKDEYLDDVEEADNYSFDDWSDTDWDNIGRPLNKMEDYGWKIIDKQIEDVK